MIKLVAIIFAITAAAQAATLALAQTARAADDVRVTEPWARATAKTARTGVVYLQLENAGDAADKLVAASTPAAGRVELHTHMQDGDVMRMRAVEAVEVGPRSKVRLQPGSLHLMLIDLKAPLTEGSHFPLTLRFEKAGDVTVEVAVQGAGSMGKGHGSSHGAGHGH